MKDENVLLGKRIGEVRTRRGWTKADLARKAGVSPSYVTRIEQGAYDRPSIDQIRAIADALGVHVAALTEPPPPPDEDEDAQRRRLIEQTLGDRAGAEFVETVIAKMRGRSNVDFDTTLGVLDVLWRSMPPTDR